MNFVSHLSKCLARSARITAVFLLMLLGVPAFGYEANRQCDVAVCKEISRILALLPAKRLVGENRLAVNDQRLAMVYNYNFSANDDRIFIRGAIGLVMFVVIEEYGKSAYLYYTVVKSNQHAMNVLLSVNGLKDVEDKFSRIDLRNKVSISATAKSKLSILLVPETNSMIGAPWGVLFSCGIQGDITSVRFGKGEWMDSDKYDLSCPDSVANRLFQMIEQNK